LQLGSAAESLSVITSAHAEDQVVRLLEPFEEYSRMLTSIKTAIQQRQDIKSAYMQSISELESKQSAWKKVANVPGTINFLLINSNHFPIFILYHC